MKNEDTARKERISPFVGSGPRFAVMYVVLFAEQAEFRK